MYPDSIFKKRQTFKNLHHSLPIHRLLTLSILPTLSILLTLPILSILSILSILLTLPILLTLLIRLTFRPTNLLLFSWDLPSQGLYLLIFPLSSPPQMEQTAPPTWRHSQQPFFIPLSNALQTVLNLSNPHDLCTTRMSISSISLTSLWKPTRTSPSRKS